MNSLNNIGLCLLFILYFFGSITPSMAKDNPVSNASKGGSGLTIAVASNFHFPLSHLIDNSPYWSSQSIRLVVASSGTLYAQLVKGAPFDLFFSADEKRPLALVNGGFASSQQRYARGKLVLYPASDAHKKDLLIDRQVLLSGKLAIANPKLAPFGAAAKTFISSLKNSESLTKQLVFGASATQAFQFVDSGNAELGLLAESVLIQAQQNLKNSKYAQYVVIPEHLYEAINQTVVIVSASKQQAQAQKFVDYVLSSQSQQILSELGYLPNSEAKQ